MREGRDKVLYKIKIQSHVCLEVWDWEHKNWLDERELEVLRLNKNEKTPEWLDPAPRLREDFLALKRLTAPKYPTVTRCRALESMTDFYLLGDASGQGFGSGLWDHEGLIYYLSNWST